MYVQNGNQNRNGGIAVEVSKLGKAIGFVASCMTTPVVFHWIYDPLFRYYAIVIGRDYADIAATATCAVEAYVVYSVVSIGVTVMSLRAVTAMVERGFRR